MKVLSLILVVLISVVQLGYAQKATNVLALENGSKMVVIPESKVEVTERQALAKYSAGSLFDQTKKVWSSRNVRFPFVFLVELAEEYNIQQLVFDNRCEFYPGIESKNVRVEFSLESKDSGFQTVGEYELEAEVLNEFIITPQKTRWIKMSILSNHGHNENVQLAEFKAMGVPGNSLTETVDISGVWHTNWQDMTFEQSGNSFTGSYIYKSGKKKFKGKVTNGTINRNSIRFDWDEKTVAGSANLYLNQEGNQISGYWKNADNPKDFNIWTMSRTKEESKPIEYSAPIKPVAMLSEEEPDLPPPPPVVKPPAKIGDEEIAAGKAIILKKVIFDLGKATVQAGSETELNVLHEYLVENPEARVKINGHTDRLGDRKKNLILSQERADAIKDYLVEKGIDKKRIETEGLGDTNTICSPPCADNRRVDFILLD